MCFPKDFVLITLTLFSIYYDAIWEVIHTWEQPIELSEAQEMPETPNPDELDWRDRRCWPGENGLNGFNFPFSSWGM